MNKVAVFIDGQNFYAGWKETCPEVKIDFTKLANWVASKISPDSTVSKIHYYTGIEIGNSISNKLGQKKLKSFLKSLHRVSNLLVKSFPKKTKVFKCKSCGNEHVVHTERDTDTTIVTDMLEAAAAQKCDSIVLMSGNATFVAALNVAKQLGRKVYVASWSSIGLSHKLVDITDGHFNMTEGKDLFQFDSVSGEEVDDAREQVENQAFMEELGKAQEKFNGAYVGERYFLTRWKSPNLEDDPDYRKDIMEDLVDLGLVEVYTAEDGKPALRLKGKPTVPNGTSTQPQA